MTADPARGDRDRLWVKDFVRRMQDAVGSPYSKSLELVARALGHRTWAALCVGHPPSRPVFDLEELYERSDDLNLKLETSNRAIQYIKDRLPHEWMNRNGNV